MRLILTFCISITLFLPFGLQAEEVIVGIDSNPPLTFFNSKKQAKGLFPDLINRVAAQEKWSVNYVPCQWDSCLDMLSQGQIDLLPAIGYTEERSQQYLFLDETVVTSWGQIYQRPGGHLSSILDLAEKKCAVLQNDVYYIGNNGLKQIATNFDITIDYVEVDSYREALTLLAAGEVDAAMVGRIYGSRNYLDFNLLPSPLMVKPIQVRPAFSHQAPIAFIQALDKRIALWKQTPGSIYYQLLDNWLGDPPPSPKPRWLQPLMYGLTAALILLLGVTLWTRKQVKIKTRLLAEKNQLLEAELEEREKIRRELNEREEQYRIFFEESHSVMLLIDPKTAQIVDANPAACRFYQYSHSKLTEMKMWQINRLGEAETYKRLKKNKDQSQQRFEFIHTLGDGSTIPVEVYRSPIQIMGKALLFAIVHDISQRKKAEKALEEKNQFLQAVIDGVSDPLMVVDLDYKVLKMNRSAQKQQKEGNVDLTAITCHQLSHASSQPCNGSDHPCPLQEVKMSGEPVTMVHHHENGQGQRIIELTASPLFDSSGKMYAIIEVGRDITERLQIEELLNANEKRLHHLAHHDSLTNLPNRLLFDDRLKQALSKARRSRRQVALFFLDLDNFKAVNDNLGHDYGDMLLIDVAKRLRKSVREGDTVARMGGDEFLILLEEIDTIDTIEATAKRVCKALNHELSKDQFRQQVSASIGISIYPEDANTPQQLMKTADLAMYRAKNMGKAGYQFYSSPQGRFIFD